MQLYIPCGAHLGGGSGERLESEPIWSLLSEGPGVGLGGWVWGGTELEPTAAAATTAQPAGAPC